VNPTTPSALVLRREREATLSIVIPLYNEAGNVDELLRRVTGVVRGLPEPPLDYEVICVDDGSRDATREKLIAATRIDPHLRVLSLSRNFGHQIAATAGLDASRGDAVVLMDGDLQDPPELIADFLERYRAGYDVVYATRRRRSVRGAGISLRQRSIACGQRGWNGQPDGAAPSPSVCGRTGACGVAPSIVGTALINAWV